MTYKAFYLDYAYFNSCFALQKVRSENGPGPGFFLNGHNLLKLRPVDPGGKIIKQRGHKGFSSSSQNIIF